MPRIPSGKRYAQAAFELALKANDLESWQVGLQRVADLTSDRELMLLLENPRLPYAEKRGLLEKRLKGTNPLVLNLALLLVKKRLLRHSRDILEKFNALLDTHRGIERAEVTTALSLGEEDKDRISRRLGEIVHRNVVIEERIDPSILGGFIIRMGDRLIDGSVRQRLESLKTNMMGGAR